MDRRRFIAKAKQRGIPKTTDLALHAHPLGRLQHCQSMSQFAGRETHRSEAADA